jgi:hypothetical protein
VITLDLSSRDRRLFEQSLATNHEVKITVALLDLDHNYLANLSSKLVDGQVNIDGDAAVTRSASLTILDPTGIIDVDSNNPNDAAMFADRMIKITYSVRSDLLPTWTDVPIFCGPVSSFARDESVVTIEAQGKEALFLPPTVAWHSASYRKGQQVAYITKDILSDRGETRFQWPSWTLRATRDWNITRESNIWQFCKNVKGPQKDRQLFYDGRGYAVLRTTPRAGHPCFTFGENLILSKPKITFDTSAIRNTVLVMGAIPTAKGAKQIAAYAFAPHNHPLSPWRLGRNGKANVMLEKVEDGSILTVSAAKQRAQDVLDSVLLEQVKAEFTCIPVPHLQEEDVITLSTGEFTVYQRIKQATIPLKVGADMTVGYTARRSVNVGRIRGR